MPTQEEIKASMERHIFLKSRRCTNPRDHDWILAEAYIAMHDAKDAIIAKLVEELKDSNELLTSIVVDWSLTPLELCDFNNQIEANIAAIKAAEGK